LAKAAFLERRFRCTVGFFRVILSIGLCPTARAPRIADRKRRSDSSLLYCCFSSRAMAESEYPVKNGFRDLCYHIGLALITWQRVEELHFHIFGRFLDVPLGQIASAAYHSTESFEARHTMLDRMAHYFLAPVPELLSRKTARQYKELRIQWQALHKLLKEANLNRNKLSHYSADFDFLNMRTVEDGSVIVEFTPYTLRPGSLNFVSRLLGRTKDKKEHNLGVEELKDYTAEFRQAEQATAAFLLELGKLPKSLVSVAEPSQNLTDQSSPTETLPPADEPPSDR
jgi:hypothetical protein